MLRDPVHRPVLLEEVIKFLAPQPGDFIIDGTVDGGGHARAILEKIGSAGNFLGVDRDKELLSRTKEQLGKEKNVSLVCGNYADMPEILEDNNLPKADGLLLDLGFSSEQLESGRGFSFQKDEPLFMTYGEEQKPVAQILKELKENELADIIFQFGGERFSRKIAWAIKEKLKSGPILRTKELRDVIVGVLPKNYERGRIDPATRTFQALRIYANDELGNLKRALENLPKVLKKGGRAAVISFHSLEDKIVKTGFRDYAKEEIMEILTKKPVVAPEAETKDNPRSRSAKLRAAIML